MTGPAHLTDGLRVDHVLWRRLSGSHHYVGSLSAVDGSVRLEGEDPSSCIEVSLVIPFAEIERVRVSGTPDEHVARERCVVVELVDADPILLAEAGSGPHRLRRLARTLAGIVAISNGVRATSEVM